MSSSLETAQANGAGEPQAPQTAAVQASADGSEAPEATVSENQRLRAENALLKEMNLKLERTIDDLRRQFNWLAQKASDANVFDTGAWGD